LTQVREAMTSTLVARGAASILAPKVRELRARLDPDTYGGAPLLGVGGVCIIGHGSSGARAVANGIAVAARASRSQLPQLIADAVSTTLSASTPSEGTTQA
jgi:glycerol-3-phosphate acyltransferase PlsX